MQKNAQKNQKNAFLNVEAHNFVGPCSAEQSENSEIRL